MTRAQYCIAAIDDAVVIRDRNPILFARASNAGLRCDQLQYAYDRWVVGSGVPKHVAPLLPSHLGAFTETPDTRRGANKRRAQRKAARSQNKRAA